MGQRKGVVPPHIQQKQFTHPQADLPCITILQAVEDPRKPSCNTQHSIASILFIVFTAILCGATNWEEIYHLASGEDFTRWLSSYVDLPDGIPSKWTLERVTSLIPTEKLQALLQQFSEHFGKQTVAIDGKTLRGSRGWQERPLHLLHAWSVTEGVCLAQAPVDQKSNEITAFPSLIEELDLKDAVVTADALHTQTATAHAIRKKKADYILPVKENQSSLLESIKLLFDEADKAKFRGIDAMQKETIDKIAGRVEERRYTLLSAEDLPEISKWAGASCVGRVERRRTKSGKTTEQTVYYITSLDFEMEQFAKSAREHWDVENGLHWALDVVFREDKHRYRSRLGAANLSLMRKVALGVLSRDTTVKKGKATKQMRALSSTKYRDHLISSCF